MGALSPRLSSLNPRHYDAAGDLYKFALCRKFVLGLAPPQFCFQNLFIIIIIFYFQLQSTYLQYLQTMYGTYATNTTILNLQNNTYLQSEILTLLTILTILTYNEILTLLTVLYSMLYIYIYKTKTKTKQKNSNLHYLHYGLHTLQKPENKRGRGSMVNFS